MGISAGELAGSVRGKGEGAGGGTVVSAGCGSGTGTGGTVTGVFFLLQPARNSIPQTTITASLCRQLNISATLTTARPPLTADVPFPSGTGSIDSREPEQELRAFSRRALNLNIRIK